MPDDDPLAGLGLRQGRRGFRLGVWSHAASSVQLCLFDDSDPDWVAHVIPMQRDAGDVWFAESRLLRPGVRYALRVDGPDEPGNAFSPELFLMDPAARALMRSASGQWRCVVPEADSFDWAASQKPRTPLDRTVIYETHVKGLTKLSPTVPEPLRGTYAGLAHESTIAYLLGLGVTAVQLLPVQQHVSEVRLSKQGLTNYWGYNQLNWFAPHTAYASRAAQQQGPNGVLREFKGMVKLLHEAGIEVFLDVVFNHTSEEGLGGPTTSLRGIDNRGYYRQTADGEYIDVTGCGNSVNTSTPAASRLILDSLQYWADTVQIDGFRFDLAVTLGRNANHEFDPNHPLLTAIAAQAATAGTKIIAEPWDVGLGGWQVGSFPVGWLEWNDGFRDQARSFWLADLAATRGGGSAAEGIGALARRLTGSEQTFAAHRGPLASVNFVAAHDGFTIADLTAYDVKHNLGNGEGGRDGSDENRSYNHGVEGPTADKSILEQRRLAMRNLLGTVLLAAGTPMLQAGDEFGRSQHGNNNAYNHDSDLVWLDWDLAPWQQELGETVRTLIRIREENPALRPDRFGKAGESVVGAIRMDWFNASGESMSVTDWDSPDERTLQYLATATVSAAEGAGAGGVAGDGDTASENPEYGAAAGSAAPHLNRVLLVAHGLDAPITVTLPAPSGVSEFSLLWDSTIGDSPWPTAFEPGSEVVMPGPGVLLLRAES